MKVLFVSQDLTHHLVPFFKSLFKYYGEINCKFAVTAPTTNRHKMGFPDYQESWVFEVFNNSDDEYKKLWRESDIIITRIWDRLDLVEDELNAGKIVFYASERWFKPRIGKKRLLIPSYFKRYMKYRHLSKFPNFCYLAMGYYAADDFKWMHLCKDRVFSFGYFTPKFEIQSSSSTKTPAIKILWAGRMLDWKRVIDLLAVYEVLQKQYSIELTLVGDGPMRESLMSYTSSHSIKNIRFLKFVENQELKSIMNKSDIYVLPSSGYEGWGAVINEAMQTKCAVIASKEIGAARSMIRNGKNGLIFPSGDFKALKLAIVKLIENKQLMESMKEEGYKTITEIWSAEEAAKRFIVVCSKIPQKESLNIFDNGPFQIIG